MRRLILLVLFMVVVSACSDDDAASQEVADATTVSTETAAVEQPATTTTTAPTTTTTEAPDVMTADDAEEMVRNLYLSYERYINDALEGDASYQEAIEILSGRNPALYSSDITDDGIAVQTCISETKEEIITFEAFYDIEVGSFGYAIDILETIEVRPGVWVVDYVLTGSAEGLPDSVERSSQIMTSGGIGPTIGEEVGDEDDSCTSASERSPEGDELVAEVEAFLAVA